MLVEVEEAEEEEVAAAEEEVLVLVSVDRLFLTPLRPYSRLHTA